MSKELLVVLNKKDSGFGISLLGQAGLPPIIYNILEDSPAAESGEVEVGDVILKVNETDVNRFTTKEVLKCLRLSQDPVTLKIKRDPKIKASVQKHILSVSGSEPPITTTTTTTTKTTTTGNSNKSVSHIPVINRNRPGPAAVHHARTNGSCTTAEQEPLLNNENERLHWEPLAANNENATNKTKGGRGGGGQPKFEAYMMTGEHILNISRMPQTATIIPKQQKKVDSSRYHNSHTHHLRHQHNSVPNSPNEMDLGYKNHCKSGSNSANTSPVSANKWGDHGGETTPGGGSGSGMDSSRSSSKPYSNFVRTSRSEDQLQGQNDSSGMSTVNIDVDEDITSSLNTLLDTRPENVSVSGGSSDKIVWTYNAPVGEHHHKFCHTLSNGSSSTNTTSPTPSSPSHSPASPTSVSSSVMSSQSGSRHLPYHSTTNNNYGHQLPTNGGGGTGDYSVSEAISNISSPDYKDDDSMGIKDCVMEISDHSDSDSTLLVSEPRQRHNNRDRTSEGDLRMKERGDKGACCDNNVKSRIETSGYQISNDYQEINYDIDDDIGKNFVKSPSPQSSEDESDVESLHSFHYSPKAVDLPSAIRLAKRLYSLDGFKKSDVSRHLSKNNDFSRAVAEEYLKYFNFEIDTLDTALRKFLKAFSLTGETQERERVLVHFSKRYLDCNPGSFNSQDAVHTLTCAIMLLNTDLHGQNMNRKMSCNEFIENLAGLNESENFPREILKQLYHAIKNYPLEWALDEETEDSGIQMQTKPNDQLCLGANPFLDIPISSNAVEYKKGYVMRKCCYEANAKRTPFHKRSWKMFYCTLRDLVLYLHKDENGFRKNQMGDNFHNAIRIHHALATKACDYTKKQYVFRLQTADQAEYLFQTSDSKELQSWIDTINFVCASFSAPPLEAAVGSQKKFQRPLLPCSHTKLNLREQLRDHEERVFRLEADLEEHRKSPPEKGSKSLIVQNYREKEAYLNYEVKRYRTYSYMLRSRMSQYPELGISLVENSIGEVDEATGVTLMEGPSSGIVPPPIPDRPSPPTNRRGPE